MSIAPLYIKYTTRSGNCYVYDAQTNEIIRVSDAVYTIIDDYHVLDTAELLEKHASLGESRVRRALLQLGNLQASGTLCDHPPEITPSIQCVNIGGEAISLKELLRERRRLLTLEITQQCNLQCEYCCYGEYYPQSREISAAPMSLNTAQDAIKAFMAHRPSRCAIGFYGGEPLLEFGLLSDIVCFAKELAADYGVMPTFSLTTNGTLLTDDKIHFLARNQFSVLISLDGDKDSHDRYRVYRREGSSGYQKGRGSYDTVVRNMERFVDLYPEYYGRGIVLTLTATSDIDKIQRFVRRWVKSYPTIISNFVQAVPLQTKGGQSSRTLELIHEQSTKCVGGFCGMGQVGGIQGKEDLASGPCADTFGGGDQVGVTPAFCRWNDDRNRQFSRSREEFVAELCRTKDEDAAMTLRGRFPVSAFLFDGTVRSIHTREIFKDGRTAPRVFRLACFPGATRTFCSVQGDLYPCEKTGRGVLFKIGDGTGDVDEDRAASLIDSVRRLCDCGNCVASRLCTHCPALISSSADDRLVVDAAAYQEHCRVMAQATLPAHLKQYTEIMEVNPHILDAYFSSVKSVDDWLNDVTVSVRSCRVARLIVEEI